jgi:hypothetical protein
MATPGTWSPGSTTITTGPILVAEPKITQGVQANLWYSQGAIGSNPYLQGVETRVTVTGLYQWRFSDPSTGEKKIYNSIQQIADDKNIAGAGYSSQTTELLRSRALDNLNAKARSVGAEPRGTQPAPPDGSQQTPAAGESTVGGLTQFKKGTFGKDNFGSLMYPITMNGSQDRIFITQLQYVRTEVLQEESDFTKLDPVGYVTLPMPNDIAEANSVGWGEDGLSNAAALLMPGLSGLAVSIAGADFGKAQADVSQLATAIQNKGLSTRVQQFLQVNAAASILKKANINVNPEAYISRATGAAINPNLELLFNGPKLRQFGFQFKMTARSQKEAIEIRKIIRFFKKGMAPRRSATNPEASFFLGTPNVFKIKFLSGNTELKSIGKFKTCALVSFTANYTPDGFYAAYNDSAAGGSQPISVTMQMGFNELTPVFSDEYGDTEDDVGPNKFDYKSSGDQTDSTALTDIQTREAYSGTDIAKRIGANTDVTRNLANQFSSSIPELNPFGQYLK